MASSSNSNHDSSSSWSWNHDVFLSFRGEDTRKTFVDHLYTSLMQQGIYTYKDDETLPRGKSIGPALLKAIQESRIAVIVFSENYADSSWCLDELMYIMKCMDERGQIVMPVFYDVDPSHVRNQKGKYEEAFVKHELVNNGKVESWRKALSVAGNLSGWVPKDTANGHESKCIKEIVDTILDRLAPSLLDVNEDLVGIRSRSEHLKSQLEMGSDDVRMVGIWGVGGGGKTTLASNIYYEISRKFDGCCFVENIREKSAYGLEKLQEKILSDVLKQSPSGIGRVEEGRRLIKRRLCHKNVLIVLDDVDHLDHLKALAGSHDWFGKGSRIIITTRDRHILKAHKVNVIHNISLLNAEESLELFRKYVPFDYGPHVEDYVTYSKHVVSYARGLPLALKVLGSFLCDRDMDEWRSALSRLKDIPESDILETLKLSYDGLKQAEKELFLDIACFYRGEYKHVVTETLDACGFHPVIGIAVLIQKALITVSHGRFDMHDLVQEMGHYIVRGEHPKSPEKHSRVWKHEDVLNICAMGAMMSVEPDKIEAIRMSSTSDDRCQYYPQGIAKMKNLRWISWSGGQTLLPTNFQPTKLCCLILEYGNQKKLWEGYKETKFLLRSSSLSEKAFKGVLQYAQNTPIFPVYTQMKNRALKSYFGQFLPNLRMIKIHYLVNLIETPDFKGLPNLERFMLHGSWHLQEIHPSYIRSQFFNKTLKRLVLSNCRLGDREISFYVCRLFNLQELDLTENRFSYLDFNVLQLPKLKWLDVSSCRRLVKLLGLPSSIAVLRANFCSVLVTLGDLSKCKWLWKVSLLGPNDLSQIGVDIVLHSMLEGNTIEDYFFSIHLDNKVPIVHLSQFYSTMRFTLQLPHYWYRDFSGFLIRVVTGFHEPCFTMIIKGKFFRDSRQVSYKKLRKPVDYPRTYVGYVSFSSLRHTTWWNSAYSMISISIASDDSSVAATLFGAALVPRKSKGGLTHRMRVSSTNCAEYWDDEYKDTKTFTIQDDSKSYIKILWHPHRWSQV